MKGELSFEEIKDLITEQAKLAISSDQDNKNYYIGNFNLTEEYLYRFGNPDEIVYILEDLLSFSADREFLKDILNYDFASQALLSDKDERFVEYNYKFAKNILPRRRYDLIEKHYDYVVKKGSAKQIIDVARSYYQTFNKPQKYKQCEEEFLSRNFGFASIYYDFVCAVSSCPYLDLDAFAKRVIEIGDLHYNLLFSRIPNADIKAHEKVILDAKDPSYSLVFAKETKNADIQAHQKVIMEYGSMRYIRSFASVEGADIKSLEDVVLKRGTLDDIKDFAMMVPGVNISAFQQKIIDSKNAEACFFFAWDVKGADIKALEKVVLESKNPKISYLFAQQIKGANIPAHGEIIFRYGNSDMYDEFRRYIDSHFTPAGKEKLITAKTPILFNQMSRELKIAKENETKTK